MKKFIELLATTFVIALVIGIIVSISGWVLQWNALQFSNGFFITGAVVVILGVVSVIGGYKMRADFGVLYSQTAGDMNITQRTQRWLADTVQSYGLVAFLVFIGGFLIIFSVIVGSLWIK